MNRLRALTLLQECTGDDIWSVEHCRLRQIPETWIEELKDCFESGFKCDSQTIYLANQVTNQYFGVRDVDLAEKLGLSLGLPTDQIRANSISRRAFVQALLDAAEESF